MSSEWLVELGWKSAVLAAATLALLWLARKRSAAEKSLIGDCGLLSLLLLPVTIAWFPRFELAAPRSLGSAVERFAEAAEPASSGAAATAAAGSAAAAPFDWNTFALGLYLLPAALLVGGLVFSLLRLGRLYRRSQVLEDARWLTALAAAQNRIGVKHGTALLISDEVNSPISWGVFRPVIMIDPAARAAAHAEAIVAHELAHVHRLDWLKLLVARLVTAIFWFNPLVWVLASRCHQLREEAADDAVLRMDVAKSVYADLLVTTVRHANSRPLIAANGVAPKRSSIAQRVGHVLDKSKSRRPAPFKWAAASLALALCANAALAASEPVLERSTGMDSSAGQRASEALVSLPGEQARTLGRAIRERDWNARRVAGITTFHEPRAIQPLMLALRDEDAVVRRIAVWGLSEMRPAPDPVATPAVSRLLADRAAEVRAEAAGALGDFESIGSSRSLEKLLLDDPSPLVRVRAAHALGDIQDPNSRAPLELALRDPDRGVRQKAGWALQRVAEAEKILSR